jgi:hypothetical protein
MTIAVAWEHETCAILAVGANNGWGIGLYNFLAGRPRRLPNALNIQLDAKVNVESVINQVSSRGPCGNSKNMSALPRTSEASLLGRGGSSAIVAAHQTKLLMSARGKHGNQCGRYFEQMRSKIIVPNPAIVSANDESLIKILSKFPRERREAVLLFLF